MTKARTLRVQDVCAVYRLISDCRDVGGNLAEWQRLALEGACRLVSASAASGGEGVWLRPAQPVRPMTTVLAGFDERAREHMCAYMREQGYSNPIFRRLQYVAGQISTFTRRDLVPNREWYGSDSFNNYRKPAGYDDQLTSVYQVSSNGHISALCVHRVRGDRHFSARERCLLSFFHAELGRLIGGALVSGIAQRDNALSPRLNQTLACLLEGSSEKQVAAQLGISQATVHQYVTTLYRQFKVQSRAELMSRVLKRRDWVPPRVEPPVVSRRA